MLGCRVWGFWGLGFSGLDFRVHGLGLRVESSGFKHLKSRIPVPDRSQSDLVKTFETHKSYSEVKSSLASFSYLAFEKGSDLLLCRETFGLWDRVLQGFTGIYGAAGSLNPKSKTRNSRRGFRV